MQSAKRIVCNMIQSCVIPDVAVRAKQMLRSMALQKKFIKST